MQKRLIIFFVPPEKIVNGGVLSIFNICKVCREYEEIHNSEVVLATYPGYKSYRKNDLFKNDETVYSFEELVAKGALESLQLHIPEYAANEIYWSLQKYIGWLTKIPQLSVNIMNQNVIMMPRPVDTSRWFSVTPNVTQTTAHDRYTTQEMANRYYMPTHHFSTFVDPRQYKWVPYEQKDKLIVLSPDVVDQRPQIVEEVTRAFPDYEIVTIQKMTYETYKATMCRAKFAITFGEGFDGYYVEAFFCGGIAYAVYNEEFFPDKDFSGFVNTYKSYDDMMKKIATDMKRHDNKNAYEEIVQQNLKKITQLYSFDNYKNNIKKFFQKRYTFLPDPGIEKQFIGAIASDHAQIVQHLYDQVSEKDKAIEGQSGMIKERDLAMEGQSAMIHERDAIIAFKDHKIAQIMNSRSWKVTKPLRAAARITKRKK